MAVLYQAGNILLSKLLRLPNCSLFLNIILHIIQNNESLYRNFNLFKFLDISCSYYDFLKTKECLKKKRTIFNTK